MSKISFGQFAALLLITDAFTIFCLSGNISAATAAGFLCGCGLQLLLFIPCAVFLKNGGVFSRAAEWFYFVLIIFYGGILFAMLWKGAKAASVAMADFGFFSEKTIITAAVGVICLCVSGHGIKALSRAAVIAGGLGIICIILMLVGSASEWRAENIYFQFRKNDFAAELARSFAISGGMGSGIILLGNVKGSQTKFAAGYFSAKAVLSLVILFSALAVTGGIMEITDFPVIFSAQLSQIFSVQRTDSIFMVIFSGAAVFSIGLQTACSAYLLGRIVPKLKKYRSGICILLMAAAGFLVSGVGIYSVIFSVISAAAPLLAVVGKRRKS